MYVMYFMYRAEKLVVAIVVVKYVHAHVAIIIIERSNMYICMQHVTFIAQELHQ